MSDEELKAKTDAKIERLYDKGLELAKDPSTREQGLRTFLAGMDIAAKATEQAIRIQKSELKYQHDTGENITTRQQEVDHYLSKLRQQKY
jgi:hypothetical protein